MRQGKWRYDFLSTVLAIPDLVHPRPHKRTQAMLVVLPTVVSEHSVLKERLRKQDTNKNRLIRLRPTGEDSPCRTQARTRYSL